MFFFSRTQKILFSRNVFAYSSTDKLVYIRHFSLDGTKMKLENTLQGHSLEVNCVRWSPKTEKWITASEDGTIRIWVKKINFFNSFFFN